MECALKAAAKFLVVAAVAVSINFWVSTTWAETGHFGNGGSRNSFHGGGHYGGFRQRSWGGWGGSGWGGRGWGWWYPWGFSYVYAPSPYYYNGYYYSPTAYYRPPVAYSSQPAEAYNSPSVAYSSGSAEAYDSPPPAPVAESPQQPAVYRPLSPTTVDRDLAPVSPRTAQRPPSIQRSYDGQSLGVADVKALAKAGVSDEVILSQIRNSHAVYRLSTADIIDLKEGGVSENIIDFMINTASAHQTEDHPSSDTGLFATTPSDDFSSSVTVTRDPTVVVRDEIKNLAESVKRLSPGRQRMEMFYTLEGKRLVVSGAEFAYLMAVTDPFHRSNLLETGLQHSFILLPVTERDQKFLLEEIPANERGRVSNLLQSLQPMVSSAEK
jgi:hypothetical protein